MHGVIPTVQVEKHKLKEGWEIIPAKINSAEKRCPGKDSKETNPKRLEHERQKLMQMLNKPHEKPLF